VREPNWWAAMQSVAITALWEGGGMVDQITPPACNLAAILADDQLLSEDDLRYTGWAVERKTVGVLG
jgi:hypothetical protein